MHTLILRVARLLCLVAVALPSAGWAQDAAKKTFTDEQLDQTLAPIALYPDSLLSQVLMASTYPAAVAEAAKWSKANPNEKGDAAVKKVAGKDWDPSVQSLVAFPQALAMMGDKPDWVQTLGDAFLAQPDDVMDRVQFLRKKAQEAGSLKTTEQQKVVTETVAPDPASTQPVSQQTVIKIEPANPQVVYVPAYNPTVVYGSWWWPAYPPFYWPPPPMYGFGAAVVRGIGFGIGVGITSALWGGFNWGHHDVDINVNRYNNINVNKQINASNTNVKWNHNAENRKGVPYRDAASREKFGNQVAGSDARQDFRGRTGTDDARAHAQQTLQERGADPAAGREKLQTVDRDRAHDAVQKGQGGAKDSLQNRDLGQARDGPQNKDFGGGKGGLQDSGPGRDSGALAGIGGGGGQARQDADRGRVSQAAASRPSSPAGGAGARAGSHAGGGAQMGGGARPSGGARGGGGGRRR